MRLVVLIAIFASFASAASASPITLDPIEVYGPPQICRIAPHSSSCKDALRDLARVQTMLDHTCYNYPTSSGYGNFCINATRYQYWRRSIIVNDPVNRCNRIIWEWVEGSTQFNSSGVMLWRSYLQTPVMRYICSVNTCGDGR